MTVRTPAGRRTGGQFTTGPKNEADFSLDHAALSLSSSAADVAAAARSVDPHLRLSAAYHPLGGTHRRELMNDPDGAVREAASNAAQYGEADLAMAFDLTVRLSAATR